jgi:hypothetical protein
MQAEPVLKKMDKVVAAHVRRRRFCNNDPTPGQARMWVNIGRIRAIAIPC